MLTFFPEPYEDELLYGLLSRYHFYSGNIELKDTLKELFEKDSIIPSFEFGSNIKILAERIGGGITAEDLIMKHTLLPYYIPFMSLNKRRKLVNQISDGDGSGVYNRIGLSAGGICRKRGIYYCPLCVSEDMKEHGETYIHRTHQLQGTLVCHKHGVKLKKYRIERSDVSRIEFLRIDDSYIDKKEEYYHRSINGKLFKISQGAYYLLNTDTAHWTQESLGRVYHEYLRGMRLESDSGRVHQAELYDRFTRFYGKKMLRMLESDFSSGDEYSWIRCLTRKRRKTIHPLRHLLFIGFFKEDIKEFFKSRKVYYGPFGRAPWPCLNPASEHYREKLVQQCSITPDYKTRVPVGTFKCECGFIYSRKGPDENLNDKYRIGRIKNYGRVWEEKLVQLLKDDKNSVRGIAAILRCDSKTVKRYDKKLGINRFSHLSEIKENKSVKAVEQIDSDTYKRTILMFISDNPALTRTEARKELRKEYIYLYRHDKEWLMENLPSRRKKTTVDVKVDWNLRDKEIREKLEGVYKELMEYEKPIRITRNILGKKCFLSAMLENRRDKLPVTEEYLKSICESIEDFQIRRIDNVLEAYEKEDRFPKRWEIYRKAGLRKSCSSKVKDYIEGIREELL